MPEARNRLRPGQIRPRDEPAQAPITGRVAGEEDEMRTPLAIADASVILLDRLPMTGQSGTLRAWPIRQALDGIRSGSVAGVRCRPASAASPRRSPGGDDDPMRVRDDRVEQLDLGPDDRMDTGRLCRRREPDDAVETLVVGDSQARQAKPDRSFNELVGGRRPVEKREVRVAMELGIGCHRTVDDRTSVLSSKQPD
jgi:hypothetical protein